MARHAHPSRHGRLILRSLVDAAAPPSLESTAGERAPAEPAAADLLAPIALANRVHPGQPASTGLPPGTLRVDGPRVPTPQPGTHRVGQPERSVKAPQIVSRDSGPRPLGPSRFHR